MSKSAPKPQYVKVLQQPLEETVNLVRDAQAVIATLRALLAPAQQDQAVIEHQYGLFVMLGGVQMLLEGAYGELAVMIYKGGE